MIVIKRDGREIPYDSSKIRDAVHKAMVSTNKESEPTAANDIGSLTSDNIEFYVDQKIKELNKDKISVEEIQDLVEKTLIEYNLPEIAKHYILYRNQRSKVRSIHSEMNQAIAQLVDPVADSDDKRENANINSDTTMGTMLKVGTTVLKDFNLKNIYRPEYSKLHNAGYMHMHDLDFSSLTINSISSDSWVVLKDSSGQVSLLKGRELDRFFNEARSEMVGFNGWQTLSLDNKFVNLELARRKHKKCMMYVVRSPSAMIRVTDEHVVPVKRDGVIKEVEAIDIKVGDELIAGKLPQLDSSIDELNLLDFLPQNVCPSIEDGHRLKLRESKLVSKFPSITLKLTRELGRLSGIFYTYGAVNEDSRVLISSVMKDNLMDEFKEIIYKLSSSVKLIPIHELHDSFFEIDDEYVSYLLRDVLCYKRYVYDYRIPGWYFNTNDEFLKGFIEVINQTALPFVDLFSKNREFVEDFRLLLKKFNIDAVVHFLPRIKNSKGEYEEDHCWYLTYKPCNHFGQEAEKTKPDYVVTSITREDYDDYVYDLQTEDHHFWSNGVVIHNCLYIPLSKLLHHGYSTGHGFLRAPSTIRSASALTCIAIQSSQNDFFGGQAIPSLDYSLAPYVAKTYIRNCVEFLKDLDLIPDTVDIKKNFIHYFDDEITKDIEKPVEQNYSIMDHLDEINSKLSELIDVTPEQLAHMHKVAKRRTTEETEQSLEATVHNLCSMASRAGSQTPFSSVNVGLSTTWEGRTVTHSLLKAVEAGLGLGETAIFPISIFKMKKGVTDKGSPNYDLFQYACKVSAKRLYPNFLSVDAPFNLIHYRKDRPEYQASAMGCVRGIEKALWNITGDVQVYDFGRMSKILMKKYPLIQYSKDSSYIDLEKADIGIWDSFNNKYAKVKKFIINKNVTDWVYIGMDDASSVTVTPDHPLPVEGRGRIRADELKEGDRIKHSTNVNLYPFKHKIATVIHIAKVSSDVFNDSTSYDVETETDRFDLDSIFSFNCITGNTRIVLMNPAGRVIYTTASYFRRLGPGVTMLHGWKILSSGGKFVDLINVSIRMETDHVNIIRASHGTIRVTDEHIIPVYRKCKYMELPAKDVQPYDCLIEVPLKDIVKEEDKLQEINLIDLLPADSNLSIAGTPKLAALMADINPDISEEEKAKMLTGDLIPDIELNYYRSVREQLADVINEDELCLVSKKASLTMKPIPVKYKLTREFGRFYGLFYSEGCVNGNLICITNSDPEIIDFAKTYLAALLHREKVTVAVNKNGCSIVSSHSVLLASLFRNNILGVHNGSGDLKLPNWFFFANDEFLKGFLSGVIDGDGSVVPQNYTRIITSSETFAEDIQAVCSRLGYIVSTSVDKQKGKIAHFKDRISIRKFDNYRVTIDNLDVVDMDLHDSIKARKLKGYTRERQYILSKTYSNRVYSIEKRDFNNYVYDFETGDHYFAAGTQKLHNCRTRVLENKVDPQHAITEGRGNLFWTTINFPLIALDAKKEAGLTSPIPIFMNKLHEIVNSVIQYSLDRFKVVAKRKAKNYPFMMGQHEYVGSEKLLPNDDIESVIKEGTMAVGFIGLSETLVALIGKHHGESEEAQELGLSILNTMKKWVDEASEKYGYNFGVMASPAEGCTGRLLRITRKKYGVIKGITDKEYFTNSFHICPTYKISAWKKVQLEAPYHAICTSGAISYVELDTDTVRNPQAFEELVNFMADSGCGYFAINHPMTRDPVCGYVGPLRPDGSCPRCGRKEFEGVAVNKLLSLTSYSPDPEYDVRLHENEDTTSNTL